jgi:poly(A) polymerase
MSRIDPMQPGRQMLPADIGHPDWLAHGATRKVISALEAARPASARFVGGCVRNTLMKSPVEDIDIATQLTPQQASHALEAAGIRVIPTGIDHGTITAIEDGRSFEITTLRRDVETDGRRAVIAYTQDWDEDAQRRDFRLNALYAEPGGRLHDPVGGGIEDALAGRVIFIGDADERLREDYLRILRFFRFNAWYGAGIDDAGLAACARQKEGLRKIAAERIWKEFRQLLAAPDPGLALTAMFASGVAGAILPPTDKTRALTRLRGLVQAETTSGEAPEPLRRLLALLAVAPETIEAIEAFIAGARLSNSEARRLRDWAHREDTPKPTAQEQSWRAVRYRLGEEVFLDALLLDAAQGSWPDDRLVRACQLARNWQAPAFPVGGNDLLSLGFCGPQVGEVLSRLKARWIASDFQAGREELVELARQLAG